MSKLEYAAIQIATGLAVTVKEHPTEEEDFAAHEGVARTAISIAQEIFHALDPDG